MQRISLKYSAKYFVTNDCQLSGGGFETEFLLIVRVQGEAGLGGAAGVVFLSAAQ